MSILNVARYRILQRSRFLIAIAILLCPCFAQHRAQAQAAEEYQVKAVFIYNFLHFIEWNPSAFDGSEDPVIIAIVGEDVFGNHLKEVVNSEKVNGRSIIIKHYSNPVEAEDIKAHVIFIEKKIFERKGLVNALVKKEHALTICDASTKVDYRGVIRFHNKNGKIKFDINQEAAKAVGLNISSKLLRLSTGDK